MTDHEGGLADGGVAYDYEFGLLLGEGGFRGVRHFGNFNICY